ncbi:nucleotidyltransferase domain-containing protein [Leptospira sp. 96542]|nr:nucleotidyltransferase domain-containing protein [Leptospira sp. 96542]
MINLNIKNQILNKLTSIEKEFDVEILLAVESGSRAWGFESLDSDYDVRFIYKHPVNWYLNILPKRDVIEIPIVDLMDYNGWDLKKAFFLMNKSNPVLFEWLRSPIVYKKNQEFSNLFFNISNEYFSELSTIYHYLHMAKKNYREFLKKDMVKAKKYFYVLRPLLACMWVENKRSSPPMEFEILINQFLDNKSVKSEIDNLLFKKRSGLELGEIPRIDILNSFIENKIEYFDQLAINYDSKTKPDAEKMNFAFQSILNIKQSYGA